MTLANRTALVTGGRGALGSVVAARLAAEGASVWVTDRSDQEVREAATSGVRGIRADVTIEQEVSALFAEVAAKGEHLDILVNTVGGYTPSRSLKDVQAGEWDRMMTLNLRSTFLCMREAVRVMQGQEYGRIISIAALAGLVPGPGRAPYAVSKAGVVLLTGILAQELKGSGVTVNCIAPGVIDTEANRALMPDEDRGSWVSPDQIASTIVFLCSPGAAGITGTTIRASGGL